jgi:hypothetical protein
MASMPGGTSMSQGDRVSGADIDNFLGILPDSTEMVSDPLRQPSAAITGSRKLSRHLTQLGITVEIATGAMLQPTEDAPT